jgi:selenocysteine-specific elongation factor
VQSFHEEHALEPGIPAQTLRSQVTASASDALFELALERLSHSGVVESSGNVLRAAGWSPRLTPPQAALRATLVRVLEGARSEPPSVSELVTRFGAAVPSLLRILEREGVVVLVESERYYAREVMNELVAALRRAMGDGREYSPAELRDVLGISRKYLIPFLEFCDRRGITARRSSGRVLQGS